MTGSVGTGCTISFGEGGYDGEVVSFSIDGEEVAVLDVTTLSSTGYRKKIPGALIEPPAFTAEIFFDAANPPPINTTATALITFNDTSELEGTGFFVSSSGEIPLEDVMRGTFVFQFDGATGPDYTPPA
jgi:hypothetical protein